MATRCDNKSPTLPTTTPQQGGAPSLSFRVTPGAAQLSKGRLRLDHCLQTMANAQANLVAPLSRAQLQRLIVAGHVRVDGQPAGRASQALHEGQAIELRLPPPTPMGLTPHPLPLRILYEDAHLLVLNKPAHLPVHPGAGRQRITLVHALLAHCHDLSGIGGVLRPGIVHRLDANTTGVLVVAKTDAAHVGLARQFAARQVHKEYLALVHKTPPSHGTLQTGYGRHPRFRQRFTGRKQTHRQAHTSWQLLATDGKISLVGLRLHTGRTHQARVHMAELGHPVLADALYGPRSTHGAPLGLDHHALHAWRIRFSHPVSHAPVVCTAPLPQSWAEAAKRLPKWPQQRTIGEIISQHVHP